MATRYKLFSDVKGEKRPSVQKITDDGRKITIPTKNAEGNTDYQEYLEGAKTNTVEAAD